MLSVACPHCRFVMSDDGSLAGTLVSCPACSGRLMMPGIVAPTRHVVRQKPSRHWAKTAMVHATIWWLIPSFLAAVGMFMLRGTDIRRDSSFGYEYMEVGKQFPAGFSGGMVTAMQIQSGFAGAVLVTGLYAVVMFVLFVFYFPRPKADGG